MDVSPEAIKEWLAKIAKDRHWLAERTGYGKRTVDNWLSAGHLIPDPAKRIIALLMTEGETAPDGRILATFTTDEFELIESARARVGSPSRPIFYHQAIMEKARRIMQIEETQGEPAPGKVLLMAAEEPAPYRTKGTA